MRVILLVVFSIVLVILFFGVFLKTRLQIWAGKEKDDRK
jgi:hypothetical protein